MKRFDVLVLGGGAAGCVLASRLSENRDRTVCLVEAGPDYGPYTEGRWPADILDARRLALDSHCWVRNDHDDRSQLRARILGGCSAHNACVVLRGAPSDYDEWGLGWSHAELEPYLDRGERTLRSRRLGDEELAPWYQAFREAAGDDAIVHVVNAADTVVIAAGSYGSPAVLLRSGIGPADELGRHGIPLVAELPVGEGLTDHVGTGAAWEPTERLHRETQAFERDHPLLMASVTVRKRSRSCAPAADDLFFFPAVEPGYEISAAALAIDHGFLREQRDADVLAEGFEALRELVAGDHAGRYAAAELRPGAKVDAAAHVRATARGFFHPVGTCALGTVVDERCRVLGFENLFVVDASVMPTIPRAMTHLSTIAIAERAAEWI